MTMFVQRVSNVRQGNTKMRRLKYVSRQVFIEPPHSLADQGPFMHTLRSKSILSSRKSMHNLICATCLQTLHCLTRQHKHATSQNCVRPDRPRLAYRCRFMHNLRNESTTCAVCMHNHDCAKCLHRQSKQHKMQRLKSVTGRGHLNRAP